MKSFLGVAALSLAHADPLACQPNAEQPMLPIYHIIGNVTKNPDGSIKLEHINDCSGVTYYEGLYHVWHQCCQNHWDHMISKDLIHWQRLPPPVQPLNLKTWDGSVSMLPKEDGGPLMLYDAQDGKLQLGSGDNPIIGVARLADINDRYLLNWTRAENNPVEIKGGDPIAFPGQVWKNGDHWNFLGQGARFQSNDNSFHTWTRMDDMIGTREHGGQWWVPMPNAIDGSPPPAGFPNRLVNVAGGERYRFGHYHPENETFIPWAPEGEKNGKEAILEGGSAGWWGGQMANNRMMIIGWALPDYHGEAGPGIDFLTRLTLVREVNYDAKTQSLVSNPLPELKRLRNSSLANEKGIVLRANATHKIKGTESGAASSADVTVTFSGIDSFEPVSFGACVLGNATTEGLGISVTVSPSAGGKPGRVASIEVGTCGDTMYKQNKLPGCDKWEADWDLPGGDYEVNRSSVLTGECTADSCACQKRCKADGPEKCKSWTLVPGQKCCLKGSVPRARKSPGMFSGVEEPNAALSSAGTSIQSIQLFDEEKVTLRITPDRSLADFFVQGGRWAGTVAWPKEDSFAPRKPTDSQISLWSSSRGVTADVNVYSMGCGWADPSYTEHPTMLDDEQLI